MEHTYGSGALDDGLMGMAHSPPNTKLEVAVNWERSICWALLLAGTLPSVLPAQGGPVAGTPQFQRLQAAVAGKRTLAVHADGRQEEIAGARLDTDGVLRGAADSTGVPTGALLAVKVRESAVGRGARAGAIVGGLVFLAGGIAAAGDDTGMLDVGTGVVALGTLVGVGGGALVGALVGSPFRYWKTVYRAPSAVRPALGFRDGGLRLGARVSF